MSYDFLNSEEKEMFLDIGCFFVGEDRNLAVRALDGLVYNDVWDCIESLCQNAWSIIMMMHNLIMKLNAEEENVRIISVVYNLFVLQNGVILLQSYIFHNCALLL